jgi:PemK-like, MazF-like toxin of type II toxin-antitoxin system
MNPVRQWDIVKVRINASDRDEHPAIVLSPAEVASSPRVDRMNVIYGSTRRTAQELRPGEILLDEADGLEHLTVFDCLLFPVVKKAAISAVVGHVSTERRRHLHRTLVAALRLFS